MRILLILTFILIASTAFAERTYYYLNYRFIDSKEFDKSKAAPLPILKLKGKEAQKALKDIMTFNNDGAILTINGEDAEEAYLQWYSPEFGIALVSWEFDNMYDVKNKVWLKETIDPSCTKTSPNGKKQIVCTPEFDGVIHYYYIEKDGKNEDKSTNLRDFILIDNYDIPMEYYWASNSSIKYIKSVKVEGKKMHLPVVASILPIEMIQVDAVTLEAGKYDKSKVKTYVKETDNATALEGLVTYDENHFVKTLKTRAGKELVVIPELVFHGYYPEQDIVSFEYYNAMDNYYTYNLTTGEAYDTIGNPETWAISPDGKRRLNYIDDLYWLEEKGADGLFVKIALLRTKYRLRNLYWSDNKTVHFQQATTQDKKTVYTPMSATLLP